MNITEHISIIGTNHISKQSLEDIKNEFLSFKPDIICVELDKQRLASLMQGDQKKVSWKAIRQVGIRGYFFILISQFFQQKMGKMTGMKPGSEMLFASQLARNNKLPLGLVDKPIDQTIKRLMKKIRFVEVMRFIGDIIGGFIPFRKKKKIKINIAGIPEDKLIDKLISELAKRYPSIYKVLIDERNHYMSKRLVVLFKKNPGKKILCVVGAGHKKEMLVLLKQYNKTIEIV